MTSLTPSATVAANVRAEAARYGFTNFALADASSLHRLTLGRRMSGRSPFTIDEIVAIARALGVPLHTLLVGIEAIEASA